MYRVYRTPSSKFNLITEKLINNVMTEKYLQEREQRRALKIFAKRKPSIGKTITEFEDKRSAEKERTIN